MSQIGSNRLALQWSKLPGPNSALRTGLRKAHDDVIIFGDCDSTYDFANLDPIYLPLAENQYDFITGDRFAGQMEEIVHET